uniref:Uncharacterized protein n=1 Tax=Chromera velia CCMP2878 TaxID=1169474 RepID=A0A0G4GC00_9ALVE|eukprot:Cvel_4484.t1-p1 / transcript=Cvel_4484.t1 / gene=Cvel_4484 / organism=Chromera_velia_CCMP2878 / gene_product=hypothetical protein / transcript_product=hypothetical protein / location=Cvel_scaffold196:45043-47086(+) / protein_length=128 / sequence_SO=supercontig / SO=protein_coding / is_pseudo=false
MSWNLSPSFTPPLWMREKQGRIGTLRERESTRLFKSLRNLSPVFLADGFPSPPEDTETKDKEKEDTQSDASEEFLWDQQLHGEKKTEGVEKISRARAREVLEERMVEVDELTVTGIGDFAFFLLKHFK